MRVKVNGQWQDRAAGMNVAGLLEALSLEPRRVAVELNRQIVPRARFGRRRLIAGGKGIIGGRPQPGNVSSAIRQLRGIEGGKGQDRGSE